MDTWQPPTPAERGPNPHKVTRVFVHGAEKPDTFIDIAKTLPLKLAALREHRSQLGDWDPTAMITGWARMQGKSRRLAAAESFRLMLLDQ